MHSFYETGQVGLEIPIQLRNMTIKYRLEDGTEYTPPYGDIHHRNELPLGIGDPNISIANIFWLRGFYREGLHTTGKNRRQSLPQSTKGLSHQHIQHGSGTIIPSIDVVVFYDNINWGILSSISQSIPIYENKFN